jgi:hypothetical protein
MTDQATSHFETLPDGNVRETCARADWKGEAIFSPLVDGRSEYRWRLSRIWDQGKPLLCWLMLNPSTATAAANDPTIAKTIRYAVRWGFGGVVVVNIFAFRATLPTVMKRCHAPCGAANDDFIFAAARECTRVVCAWGAHGAHNDRGMKLKARLTSAGIKLYCLAKTRDGHPVHPLYQRDDAMPQPYNDAAKAHCLAFLEFALKCECGNRDSIDMRSVRRGAMIPCSVDCGRWMIFDEVMPPVRDNEPRHWR